MKKRTLLAAAVLAVIVALAVFLLIPKQAAQPEQPAQNTADTAADDAAIEDDWRWMFSATYPLEQNMPLHDILQNLKKLQAKESSYDPMLQIMYWESSNRELPDYGGIDLILSDRVTIRYWFSPPADAENIEQDIAAFRARDDALPLSMIDIETIPNWQLHLCDIVGYPLEEHDNILVYLPER